MKEVDVSSLEHTSWRCQYHVVFAPKYRRQRFGNFHGYDLFVDDLPIELGAASYDFRVRYFTER